MRVRSKKEANKFASQDSDFSKSVIDGGISKISTGEVGWKRVG